MKVKIWAYQRDTFVQPEGHSSGRGEGNWTVSCAKGLEQDQLPDCSNAASLLLSGQ